MIESTISSSKMTRRLIALAWIVLALVLAAAAFGLIQLGADSGLMLNYLIVFVIGLMVGMTEMMARYPDAPFRPLLSFPGVFYFAVNGGATILAYYLITLFDFVPVGKEPVPASQSTQVYQILAASLGAMAFFRSGFFTMRIGDGDVAVGPNLILQVLLQALDRAYDRDRAHPRSELVAQIMGGVSFESAREALPMICFNLMQNITEEEREAVGAEVAALAQRTGMSDESRVLNLGLMLMNLVGEKTLRAAILALGPTVQGVSPIDSDLVLQCATVPAGQLIAALPVICNELCHGTARMEDPATLIAEIQRLDLPDDNKAMLVVYKAVRQYGLATVRIAVSAIA